MCQYSTNAPAQGLSLPRNKHFTKKKKKLKKGHNSIIIGGVDPELNLTYILW